MTNLRLPGQYDERLLGSLGLQGPYYNWNRWYLPGVGRYLEPDPEGFKSAIRPRGETGEQAPHWYSYAGENPLRFMDPEGRYTKDDECKYLPTEEDLRESANFLSDGEGPWGNCSLRKCVLEQVDKAHINCRKVKEKCKDPNHLGWAEGSCQQPGKKVGWCSRKVSINCKIDAMIHELAHSCGWHHGDGGGVPGNNALGIIASCEIWD